MGNSCACTEGIAAFLSLFRSRVMLPAPSYVQEGSCFALSHRSPSGSKLLQTYHVSSELMGEGTFGTVVRSTSKETGSACVLKQIDKREVAEEILISLANEIAIHEVCDHPSIVRLYETFEDVHHIHIAMEACEGGEVLELLYEQGPLSEVDAGLVMQQVLQAVLYLHGVKQVAHRDLKPDNLLLKSRGVPLAENSVKVIDFGLAASFTPGKRSLSLACGTPTYMAPETLSGAYDQTCDIWSCGIMTWELLTGAGSVPFTGSTYKAVLRDAASRPLVFERSTWGCISDHAKDLIRSMCNKDPSGRASAEDALQSAWFSRQRSASFSSSSSEAMAENLRSFSQLDDFQKAALRLAAYHLDDPQVADQRTAFRMLDKNGDGRLCLDEVMEGCLEIGLSAAEARELFGRLDADGSSCLEYSEFLGAAVSKESLPLHACWEAFRFCDEDRNGSISQEEIRKLLGRSSRGPRKGATPLAEQGADMDFKAFATMLRGGKAGGA